MAGLLDGLFDSESGRMGLGLLAAGSARGDGAGFGQRLSEAVGSVDQWKKAKAQAEYQKQQAAAQQQQMAMQAMQMQQYQAQAAQQQAAAQEQARINGILPSLVKRPSQGAPAMNVDSLLSPEFRAGTPTVGAVPASAGGFDMQEALRQRVPLKTIEELQKLTAGPEYSPEVRYDQSGKAFMTAKNGDVKYLSGINARDKLVETDLGGTKGFRTEYSPALLGSLPKTQSPDSLASNQVAWANFGLSKDRLNFDKQGGASAMKPQLVGDQWITAPSNMKPGEVRPAMPSVMQKDAKEALQLIESAKKIIPQSTGSYAGAGADQVARFFGSSTNGDTAAAQLKALEGSLVSKMPKMSGPQSDKDVALYRQMAGEIGDPTIPQSRKLAALQVIEEIQQRNSGVPAPAATKPATMRWNPKTNSLEMVN